MELTSKQRAYLKGLAMKLDPAFNVGKESLSPGVTEAVNEALAANELVKVGVLKNCADDPKEIASIIGERTHSVVVQVIGKKMVFYRPAKKKEDQKIVLPKGKTL